MLTLGSMKTVWLYFTSWHQSQRPQELILRTKQFTDEKDGWNVYHIFCRPLHTYIQKAEGPAFILGEQIQGTKYQLLFTADVSVESHTITDLLSSPKITVWLLSDIIANMVQKSPV